MRWYIDLDTDQLISGPGTNDPVRSVSHKRGETATIEVQFSRNGIAQELADGATGIYAIKADGKYDAAPLVQAGSWELVGTGVSALYVFEPDFDTPTLNALLGHGDGDAENDEVSVDGMAEIQWIENGSKHKTQTFEAIIENDVIKEMDADPAETSGPTRWMPAALELDEPPENGELASGYIYPIGSLPQPGDPLTVGSVNYVFADYPASNPFEIQRGYDVTDVTSRIIAAINGTDFVNEPHPQVSAGGTSGGLMLTSKVAGEAGNGIVISTGNPEALDIDPMTGGVDGTAAKCAGQTAIVDQFHVYTCVRFSPVRWRGPVLF